MRHTLLVPCCLLAYAHSVHAGSSYRNPKADVCISAGIPPAEGNPVTVEECGDAESQTFTMNADGRLVVDSNQKLCLDAGNSAGGDRVSVTLLTVSACDPSNKWQTFTRSGNMFGIKANPSKCLDNLWGRGKGNQLSQFTCTDATNTQQEWVVDTTRPTPTTKAPVIITPAPVPDPTPSSDSSAAKTPSSTKTSKPKATATNEGEASASMGSASVDTSTSPRPKRTRPSNAVDDGSGSWSDSSTGGGASVRTSRSSKSSNGTDSVNGASTDKSTSSSALVLMGAMGGVLLFAVVAFAIWVGYRRGRSEAATKRNSDLDNIAVMQVNHDQSMDKTPIAAGYTSHSSTANNNSSSNGSSIKDNKPIVSIWDDPVLNTFRMSQSELEPIRAIGTGAYAEVWLVRRGDNEFLASKRLSENRNGTVPDRARIQSFLAEIKLNARLRHTSVVTFVGVAWSCENDVQALFEFMENGDLRSHLDRAKNQGWTLEKLNIALNVLEALVYVHSFDPPVVHRDLKSRNVLLDHTMYAKLADFGISRELSDHATMTGGVGTARWLAPEVMTSASDYDEKCDIFSFGVVMSELDTHWVPYSDVCGSDGEPLREIAICTRVVAGALTPTLSSSSPLVIRELAQQCMAFHPTDRPSAVQASFALRRIIKEFMTQSLGQGGVVFF